MNFKIILSVVFYLILSSSSVVAQKIYEVSSKKFQNAAFEIDVAKILEGKKATVGIAIIDLKDSQRWAYTYSDEREEESLGTGTLFPTMSVYKFHLALAVLKQVDKGKVELNDKFFLTDIDLLEETYSPLRENLKKKYGEEYPNKSREGIWVKLSELISYMVSKSDNNACDILFRFLGGKTYTARQNEKKKLSKILFQNLIEQPCEKSRIRKV